MMPSYCESQMMNDDADDDDGGDDDDDDDWRMGNFWFWWWPTIGGYRVQTITNRENKSGWKVIYFEVKYLIWYCLKDKSSIPRQAAMKMTQI